MEQLERYSRDMIPDDEEPTSARHYRAFATETSGRRAARLRVVYPDGKISILSYSYLQEILCTNHQNLSLIFTSSVITLEGRNLWSLLDVLQADKVRVIHCYNPARFPDQPGTGEPVVFSIKRQSLRDFTAGPGTPGRVKEKEAASTEF